MSKKPMNRILQHIADQATPPDFDLWKRIEAQIAPPVNAHPPTRRRASISFALAGAMVVIFVALWLVRPNGNKQMPTGSSPTPTPTTAATTQPTISFQGTFVAQLDKIGSQDNYLMTYNVNVWYSAPEKHRYETYINGTGFHQLGNMPFADLRATAAAAAIRSTPEGTAQSDPYQLLSLDVSDGQRRWLYDAGRGGAIEEDVAEAGEQIQLPTLYAISSTGKAGLADLITYLSATFNKVTQLREESYLDRPTYVIQMQPKVGNNPLLGKVTDESRIVMWVDQQTFLQLRYEYYSTNTMLSIRRMFTTLNFDKVLDPTLFRLNLPPSAWTNAYIDVWFRGNGQTFATNAMWHLVAQAVPFNIYQPDWYTFNPDGLLVGKADYDAFSGTLSGAVYSSANPYGPPAVTIIETTGAQPSSGQGIPIESDNGYATIGYYTEENGTKQFTLYVGGTLVVMSSTDPTINEFRLITLAKSFAYAAPWYKSYDVAANWRSMAQRITFPLYATDTNLTDDKLYGLGIKQTAAGLPTYSDTSNTVSQAYYDTGQPVTNVFVTESPSLPTNLDLSAAQSVRVGPWTGSYYIEKGDYRWLVIHAPGTYITLQARAKFASKDDLFQFGASFQRVTQP